MVQMEFVAMIKTHGVRRGPPRNKPASGIGPESNPVKIVGDERSRVTTAPSLILCSLLAQIIIIIILFLKKNLYFTVGLTRG